MSVTVETAIWQALNARVQSMSLTPSVPVVFPKQDAPDSRHIIVSWMPNRNQRRAVGSNSAHIRPGILQLSLMSPIPGQAVEVETEIAGQIAAHFPADLRMSFGGVTVRVTQAPDVATAFRASDVGGSNRDGKFWHTPVSVSVQALI